MDALLSTRDSAGNVVAVVAAQAVTVLNPWVMRDHEVGTGAWMQRGALTVTGAWMVAGPWMVT